MNMSKFGRQAGLLGRTGVIPMAGESSVVAFEILSDVT